MTVVDKLGGVVIMIVTLGCAVAAPAATIEDAYRIVDRAEPLRCEIRALEAVLKLTPEDAEDHARLSAAIVQARARLKEHYIATMGEYIEIMKQLPFEDRKKVYAYSEAVAERCSSRDGK